MSCTNFHKHSLVFSAHFTLDTQGLLGYSWNFLMFMAYLHCYWNCQTYLHCYWNCQTYLHCCWNCQTYWNCCLNCQTHWNCCLNCQTYWNCCLLQNGNEFVTITGKNCRGYLSFIWLVAKNIYINQHLSFSCSGHGTVTSFSYCMDACS